MAAHPFSLEGKVAIVTGAGQGFGRAFALALAQAGAAVAVTDIGTNSDGVQAVCDEITGVGGSARGYDLDVRQTKRIPEVVDQVVVDFGKLDIIVNNAGVTAFHDPLDITEEDWDRVLDVNLKGLFFCAQAAARHMVPQGSGRIINIASQRVVSARPSGAAYVASKGGVAGLTRALALAWAKNGVTVNAMAPAATNTGGVPMLPGPVADEIASRSPLGRAMTTDEVVGSIVFLASDAASGVNGHTLLVDAGWTVG